MPETKDFTLQRYSQYLDEIKVNYKKILRFQEYFVSDPIPDSFCIIRHDIDRRPINALKMARIEYEKNIRTTYYFRTKSNTYKPDIIKSIANLEHEIGYHYECLSDSSGNIDKAMQDFSYNLERLRHLYPIKTIAMHGRPLSRFDNREMWKDSKRHEMLFRKFGILGEVYLDINYTDIAYISDTGRNWSSTASNIRDKVISSIAPDFDSGKSLYDYLRLTAHPKMIFQTHPERWSSNSFDFWSQLCQDSIINFLKIFLRTQG